MAENKILGPRPYVITLSPGSLSASGAGSDQETNGTGRVFHIVKLAYTATDDDQDVKFNYTKTHNGEPLANDRIHASALFGPSGYKRPFELPDECIVDAQESIKAEFENIGSGATIPTLMLIGYLE